MEPQDGTGFCKIIKATAWNVDLFLFYFQQTYPVPSLSQNLKVASLVSLASEVPQPYSEYCFLLPPICKIQFYLLIKWSDFQCSPQGALWLVIWSSEEERGSVPLSYQGLVPCPLEGTWASQSTLPLVSSSSKVGSRKGQVALVADRNDCFIVELFACPDWLPCLPITLDHS